MVATTHVGRLTACCTARCAPTTNGAISKGAPRVTVAAVISKGGQPAAAALSTGGPSAATASAAISKGGHAAAFSPR